MIYRAGETPSIKPTPQPLSPGLQRTAKLRVDITPRMQVAPTPKKFEAQKQSSSEGIRSAHRFLGTSGMYNTSARTSFLVKSMRPTQPLRAVQKHNVATQLPAKAQALVSRLRGCFQEAHS